MKTLRILAAIALLLVSAGRRTKASAATLTTLHSFTNGVDGSNPQAPLIQGSDGFFYGTTYHGGSTNNDGTIFKTSSSGAFSVLHVFGGSDGALPQGELVQGSDGNFYGTTTVGGTNGLGTVFKITSAGTFNTLYQFSGLDGSFPVAGLMQSSDGLFYGVTQHGGINTNCGSGCGTAFNISSTGTLTTLYQFGGLNGSLPEGTLVQGSDGNFYGTTSSGGTNSFPRGTVFKMTPAGTLTSLYSFGVFGGNTPIAGLVEGTNGSFYGTTEFTVGSVFQITSTGLLTTLHSFSGGDGFEAYAGLVQGSDGNFYGTTIVGGGFAQGTVFEVTPSGTFTSLYSFAGTDGGGSYGSLVQGVDGSFYGTTYLGGVSNVGTVFQLFIPLSPTANQVSSINVVSTDVLITVPSVAGETYQLQSRTSLDTGNWSNVAGALKTNSIGGLLTLTDFGNGSSFPQLFYRFAITP